MQVSLLFLPVQGAVGTQLMHMTFKKNFWGRDQQHIFYHHWTQARRFNWANAWSCCVGPKQGNHSGGHALLAQHLRKAWKWSTTVIRDWTALLPFACTTAQSVSLEMGLSSSSIHWTGYREQKPYSYSSGLSGFSYMFIHLVIPPPFLKLKLFFFWILWASSNCYSFFMTAEI